MNDPMLEKAYEKAREKGGEMMSFLEAHASSFGDIEYEGRRYVLISAISPYVVKDEAPRYDAEAVCVDDERDEQGFQTVYQIFWPITDRNQLDYISARLEGDNERLREIGMAFGVDDNSVIIEDRNIISSLRDTMYKYNVDSFSRRYQWD